MNLLKRFSKKQETEAVEVPVRESGTALAQQNALRIAMTLVRSDFSQGGTFAHADFPAVPAMNRATKEYRVLRLFI